jgi:oxygen-independent coproporphyrinogen III oxidase
MAGIYFHIPFCKQACHYCNFHFSTSLQYRERMVEALVAELEQRRAYLPDGPVDSLYFGGGTPSLLPVGDLLLLLEKSAALFDISPGAEITVEANPDDLTPGYLDQLQDTPVNRLSIGIQSFDDKILRWMNRAHNSSEATKCLSDARSRGFDRLTADLIYGVPGQTMEGWLEDVQRVLDAGGNHLSAYALTVEPATALGKWVERGQVEPVDERFVREQFDALIDRLDAEGWIHYEVSNFAREGALAVHNANYWRGVPYLGIGPSAHSFDGADREWNVANNMRYMQGIETGDRAFEREVLSEGDRYNELVMTGLRTIWGVQSERLREMGEDWLAFFTKQIGELEQRGWVEPRPGGWGLTREGLHWADRAASELFFTT